MARTKRVSDNRKREKKWHACWCCRDQQRACRMAQALAGKLEHTGTAEKKELPQCHRESIWQVGQAALAKRKRNRALCPDHQIMRCESRTLVRERGDQSGSMGGKGGLYSEGRQVPIRRGRASKDNLPRRSRRKHKWVCRRKSSLGGSALSWF